MGAQLEQLTPSAGGLAAGLAAALAGLVALRRRLSRDQTEMTKDRIESKFVERLLSERDQAVGVARELGEASALQAATIARQDEMIRHQAADIARLQREFASFKRLICRLYPDAQRFLASEPSPLDPLDLQL